MTPIGLLVLLGAIVSVAFLVLHGTTQWRQRPAGIAVFVMAAVTSVVMVLASLRVTFGIVLPDWFRFLVYVAILTGMCWKLVTLVRYRWGDLKDPDSVSDEREAVG